MPSGRRRLSLVLLPFLSAACGESSTTSQEGSGRPSTPGTELRGDTVVRADEPLHPLGGTLTPNLTIGLVDGPQEYLFGRVYDGALGPDGHVYVLDGQAQQLRKYDTGGAFVRRFGGPGEGPGEYRFARMVAVLSDGRVLVGEDRGGRVLTYSSDGAFLESWTVGGELDTPLVLGATDTLYVRTRGAVPARNHELALYTRSSPSYIEIVTNREAPERQSMTLLMSAGGEVLDTVPAPELPDLGVYVSLAVGHIYVGVDYMPFAWWAWSPLGYLVTGRTDRYAIDLHVGARADVGLGVGSESAGVTGRATRSIVSLRRTVEPIPIPAAERELSWRLIDEMLSDGLASDAVWHGPVEAPESKPPYHSVGIGAEGRIWVRLHAPSILSDAPPSDDPYANPWEDEASVFDLFEPDGRYVGQALGPAGLRPLAMRGDTLLARTTDPTGVDTVTRFVVEWH